MPNSILFHAEHLENETQHIIDIPKDLLSDYFNGNCPRNEISVQWLKDERFQDYLIDAADFISRNQWDEFGVREAVVGYRLFAKSGKTYDVCSTYVKGNITNFMSREKGFIKYETIYS